MSSGAMRKKFVVQQPPFVANSSGGNGGVRPKRREDHNNNDLDHFPGRHWPNAKVCYSAKNPLKFCAKN